MKEEIPSDFIPKKLLVTALGDSLTKGVGDSTNQGGYLNYLENDLLNLKGVTDVQISNFGVTGYQTYDMIGKLKEEDVKKAIGNSDLILITIGGNDIMQVIKDNFMNLQLDVFDRELLLYKERLNEIIKMVRTYNPNGTILLVGVYNPFTLWFNEIDEIHQVSVNWNAVSEEVTNQYNKAYFVNVSQIFTENGLLILHDDYFHPNDQGYQLIANEIFSVIRKHTEEIFNNGQPIKEVE
jgi:lysophospholipase L1-like esterase